MHILCYVRHRKAQHDRYCLNSEMDTFSNFQSITRPLLTLADIVSITYIIAENVYYVAQK